MQHSEINDDSSPFGNNMYGDNVSEILLKNGQFTFNQQFARSTSEVRLNEGESQSNLKKVSQQDNENSFNSKKRIKATHPNLFFSTIRNNGKLESINN
jgi:hypothetical protein